MRDGDKQKDGHPDYYAGLMADLVKILVSKTKEELL